MNEGVNNEIKVIYILFDEEKEDYYLYDAYRKIISTVSDLALFQGTLKEIWEDPTFHIVGHDLKPFFRKALTRGVNVHVSFLDLKICHFILHPNESDHGMEALFSKYQSVQDDSLGILQLISKLPYLHKDIWNKIIENGCQLLIERIEMPLLPVLVSIENTGIAVNQRELKNQSEYLTEEVSKVQSHIYKIVGEEFNLNSPKQLQEVLFNRLEIHKNLKVNLRRTKTGFSTNEAMLTRLKSHPVVELILKFRHLSKLRSTYLEALPQFIAKDGRIHTH